MKEDMKGPKSRETIQGLNDSKTVRYSCFWPLPIREFYRLQHTLKALPEVVLVNAFKNAKYTPNQESFVTTLGASTLDLTE